MIEIKTKSDFENQLNNKKRVLALFYTSWCPFCREFMQIFNEDIKRNLFDVVLCVNMDDYSNPIWEDYSINNVPTVIFFNNGKIKNRIDGKSGLGLTKSQFDDLLSRC
jgi:thiol-disulfide isomerase/thioredoxin